MTENKENITKNKWDNKEILVLSGGGVKGICTIGVFKKLEELGINKNIKTIAGTSIGAFLAGLYNIGYTSEELLDFVILFDLNKFRKMKIMNILNIYGVDSGDRCTIILEKMFEEKGFSKNITFKELYEKTKKELIITTCCVNDKKVHYMSYKNFPDLSVIKSIRMSISIPIYFSPVEYNGNYYVDGACIDNYPIKQFKNDKNKIIGVYLSFVRKTEEIKNLESYIWNVIQCFIEGVMLSAIDDYEDVSINISTESINLIDTNLSKEKILELFNIGYEQATKYFA